MDQEIKITGTPSAGDPMRCTFMVDRPLFPNRSYFFPSAEKALGSPLVERLFAIPGIASVLVAHDSVTVTKEDETPWPEVGRAVGAAIRGALASGAPPVSETILENLPPPETLREVVQHLLDSQVNPAIAAHGGVVDLIDVRGNTIYLQLGGGCQGCGMADVTLRGGIERLIREMVPEVGEILDVTDHASGRNPYYAASTK